ncbi:hypothetical protein FACS1894219_09470 [Clostridia bacterium]|nr:hypothetical protein FACS1894219_09470 [Clostridia bacterium]
MLIIKPVQSKEEQRVISDQCGIEYDEECLVYAAKENDILLCSAQFRIIEDRAVIYRISAPDSVNDTEALILLGKATLNFIDKCGIESVILKEPDKKIARLLGFKEADGVYKLNLAGYFESPCKKQDKFTIRSAVPGDAEALCELYSYHLTANPPQELPDIVRFREFIRKFEADVLYNILVADTDDAVVSSVTLIIIENLTHNMRPYALIENVVTHSDKRGKGIATALLNRATEIATDFGCYKIMLMTGSKKESTLNFYKKCGFNCDDKTGFIKWL